MPQNIKPTRPINGSELPVFGSLLAAVGAAVAAGAVPDVGAAAAASGPFAGAAAAGFFAGAAFATTAFSSGVRIASTCVDVMTSGGFSVTMVAVSLSPV